MADDVALTRKQRRLVTDFKELIAAIGLDLDRITAEPETGLRTTLLELAKDKIIRSAVVIAYVLIDESLSVIVSWHYFGRKKSFRGLWKTKRFTSFNYFVLERLYLLNKLDLVEYVPASSKRPKNFRMYGYYGIPPHTSIGFRPRLSC
jgi:hypothetical protein